MDTKKLKKLDREYIWHPFTQMREWIPDDVLVIKSGKGSYLEDTDGKRYLDGVSSLWCNMHGHRVSEIDRALKAQVGKIAHSTFLGLTHVSAIELSKKLIKLAPRPLNKVFYSDSGATAVEIALKMAYQYWQQKGRRKKTKFIHLTNAYHGDTIGSVSVGGIDLFHQIFEKLLFKSISVKGPDRYHERFQGRDEEYLEICAARVEKTLKANAANVAAIIMEPLVQGAAGMIMHPKGFLRRVRDLAKRYDVLLIVDEVATGFGRTGKLFASEHERVSPDILCLAKGLTAGYMPLAATLATDEIYKAFLGKYEEFKTFFHGHTYTANPLACAAAIANIDYIKKNQVLAKAQGQIREISNCLKKFRSHPNVGDIRQCGMMVGIELVKDAATGEAFELKRKIGQRVCRLARTRGVIIRPLGNVIVWMPPFCFTTQEIRKLSNATHTALCEILNDGCP